VEQRDINDGNFHDFSRFFADSEINSGNSVIIVFHNVHSYPPNSEPKDETQNIWTF